MKIKGCELKNETVLEIGRFAILWNCFESEWCNNKCNPYLNPPLFRQGFLNETVDFCL